MLLSGLIASLMEIFAANAYSAKAARPGEMLTHQDSKTLDDARRRLAEERKKLLTLKEPNAIRTCKNMIAAFEYIVEKMEELEAS